MTQNELNYLIRSQQWQNNMLLHLAKSNERIEKHILGTVDPELQRAIKEQSVAVKSLSDAIEMQSDESTSSDSK